MTRLYRLARKPATPTAQLLRQGIVLHEQVLATANDHDEFVALAAPVWHEGCDWVEVLGYQDIGTELTSRIREAVSDGGVMIPPSMQRRPSRRM